MLRISVFLICVTCIDFAAVLANDAENNRTAGNPVVTTSLGRVKGSYMTTRLGKQIYSFRGMRYAEPPTGQQRFKVAVPAKSWSDVFDASEEGPSCPRPTGRLRDEDCLRLNVYSTKLPANASSANAADGTKKAVMVFFHPGGFYTFSSQSYLWGPQYILDQDIVLVTVNYRIGALGFLALNDSLAPGNLGLKDQVVALRWVKNNIKAFGGDPNSVTICGYSSGGRSVALHMLSPMSKGLFHKVIAMSGSPTAGEPLDYDQIVNSKKQARFLNCPDDTSANIIECLRTKSSEEMAATRSKFSEWHNDPLKVWAPVVEPDIPGVERFIVGQPADLIRQGKIHDVPFMAGVNRDEFGYFSMLSVNQARKGNDSIFRDLNENWTHIAPISFQYERDTRRSERISQGLRDFYFKGEPIGLKNYEGLAHCYADSLTGFSMHRLVNLVASVAKQPVYYYRFVYEGRYSHSVWEDTKKPFGVSHHDELLYLFYISLFPYFEKNAPEISTVERMTAMWANFVKTGEPIPKNNKSFDGIKWEKFTPQNNRYMEINDTLTMKTGLNLERMRVHERLFPLESLPCAKKV